jgi:hypothetical protein
LFFTNIPGDYDISFRIYNTELGCFSEKQAHIKVLCGSQVAPPSVSSFNPEPGEQVTFTGYPNTNAVSQIWLLNGVSIGFNPFNYIFNEAGENTAVFITSNGVCSDTSQVFYIPVGSCNK